MYLFVGVNSLLNVPAVSINVFPKVLVEAKDNGSLPSLDINEKNFRTIKEGKIDYSSSVYQLKESVSILTPNKYVPLLVVYVPTHPGLLLLSRQPTSLTTPPKQDRESWMVINLGISPHVFRHYWFSQ